MIEHHFAHVQSVLYNEYQKHSVEARKQIHAHGHFRTQTGLETETNVRQSGSGVERP